MSHTFLIEVREFNLETYCFQEFFLDSFIVRRAFARKIRGVVGWCDGAG